MKLVTNNNYLDGKIWRCIANNPNHDIKFNLRKNSIFDNVHIPLQVIFFIAFYCFPENYS